MQWDKESVKKKSISNTMCSRFEKYRNVIVVIELIYSILNNPKKTLSLNWMEQKKKKKNKKRLSMKWMVMFRIESMNREQQLCLEEIKR